MAVGESRTELLQWLNSTLQLDYAKVEQCGTGAAYCQLLDSIYGGVPMAKVKFGSSLSEYDARNNMKILQAAFNRNNITKSIEVERLIKCRLQDNLELLQWFKRHWMENQDVHSDYDAVARRRSGPQTGQVPERGSRPSSRRTTLGSGIASGGPATPVNGGSRVASTASSGLVSVPKRRVSLGPTGPSSVGTVSRSRNATPIAESTHKVAELTVELERTRDELAEAKILTESLETERNFYFNKLREIEILTQNIQEHYDKDDDAARQVQRMSVLEVMDQIQEILYLTQKGFEVQDSMDTELF